MITEGKSLREKKWIWVLLTLILLLGGALRVIYLSEIKGEPDFAYPTIDASYHDYWARGLATGVWTVPEGRDDPQIYRYPFYRPPGYAYFLASIYWVFGGSYLWPRVAQMAFGLAAAALAFLFSRRWFGEAVGLITALLVATYWIFIYFEGELVGVVLAVFLSLFLISILARLPGRTGPWWGWLCGVVAGGYALLRPNVLLFLPVAAGWAIWAIKRRGGGRWLSAVVGLFLGTAAAILPVTVRNYLVSGEVVPIATNAGLSLRVANSELSDGTTHFMPEIGDVGSPYDYPRIVRRLGRQLGRPLNHSEASRYLAGRAIRFMEENPGRFLYLLGRKALLFWGPREIRNLKEIHFARLHSPLLRKIPGNFPLVAALFVVGVILVFLDLKKRKEKVPGEFETVVLMFLFVGAYFLSMLPFAAAARYRVPIIPFLLIFGAYGLVRIGESAWKKKWKRAAFWAAAGTALYGLASVNFTGFKSSPEKWHFDRALAYTAKGDWREAVRECREAIELKPGYADAYTNMGVNWQNAGKLPEAVESYRTALRLKPGSAKAHKNLADALFQLGETEVAFSHYREALKLDPAFGSIYCDLAGKLADEGRLEEAIAQYNEALRAQPDNARAHNGLGSLLYDLGRKGEALEHYRRAIRINPSYAGAHYNLAYALGTSGDPEGAIEHYRRALRIDPGHVDSLNNLGVTLTETGRPGEAVACYERAIELAPRDAAAYYNLGVTLARGGKIKEAIGYLEKVIELEPDYGPARQAVEYLRGGDEQ